MAVDLKSRYIGSKSNAGGSEPWLKTFLCMEKHLELKEAFARRTYLEGAGREDDPNLG